MQRHGVQMLMQQTDNLRAAQIIYANIHMKLVSAAVAA
jgi:hypothetical protein